MNSWSAGGRTLGLWFLLPAAIAVAASPKHIPATWDAARQLSAATVAKRIELARVSPGDYKIGTASEDPLRRPDEIPSHYVAITRAFDIGRFEVTQAEWFAVIGNRPSYFSHCGPLCPVENISWFEAIAFTNALSKAAGLEACYDLEECNDKKAGEGMTCLIAIAHGQRCRGFRLPTEAEWEVAARGGTRSHWYSAPSAGGAPDPDKMLKSLTSISWFGDNADVKYEGGMPCPPYPTAERTRNFCGTQPVGGKTANSYGLHDVIGNVIEWTGDWYSPEFYRHPGGDDPIGPPIGEDRVLRGGGFNTSMRDARVARRRWENPTKPEFAIGFRVVKTVMPAEK